ncbi:MAG: methyl-accepting chemotaxis protein [Acidobacteriaceae bacterium]
MHWFTNLNAKPRLLISFGVLVALITGVCSLAIHDLSETNQSMVGLYQQDMAGAIDANNIQIARFSLGRAVRDAMLNINNPQSVAANAKSIAEDFAKVHSNLDAAEKLFVTKDGIADLAAARNALPAYEAAYKVMLQRIEAKDLAGARAALLVANDVGAPLFAGVDKAKTNKENHAAERFRVNEASYQTSRTIMLSAALLAAVLGILLALMIARGFSIPLTLAVQALEKVALGDLTASLEVDSADEMGRMGAALNEALGKLRETLQDVAQNAAGASASSQELAAAADAIASGAQQQAASLEQTSASLEQITATVRQSADHAKQASQVASGSRDSAEHGQLVVADAVTAMSEINAASAKISDIISTIDEIAFQTNLLAVNAAVEAARAGEEGRGFAVVATEVRSLAQRSAGAAKEIKTLIQDSLRKVEKGTELVNKSGETLRSIVGSVKGVTDIVNEIAAAAAEQSTGVEQVNTAMTQMDQVTQSNAAQTEQLSSTAQALSEQSLRLKELVSVFVLGHDSKWPAAVPASRRVAALRPPLATKFRAGIRTAATSAAVSKSNGSAVRRPGNPQAALAVASAGDPNDGSFEEF